MSEGSNAVGIVSRAARYRGYHARGDHDLADAVIIQVHHLQIIPAIQHNVSWTIKLCSKAVSIGITHRCSSNTLRAYHLSDFVIPMIGHIEVSVAIQRNSIGISDLW